MYRLDYIIRKAGFALITVVAVITVNFYLFRIVPGDPIAMMVSSCTKITPHFGV